MRKLELLEAREHNKMNQINPPQMSSPGCTYCHALTHIFEECPVYQAQQMLPDNMNISFTRQNYNPYSKTYNPGWRNHPNFSWSQSGLEQPRQNFPSNSLLIVINPVSNQISSITFSPITNINLIQKKDVRFGESLGNPV